MKLRLAHLIPALFVATLAGCSDDDSPTAAVVVPGAPTAVVATIGNSTVSLAFTTPASDGGSPITNYLATCTGPDATLRGSGAASPVVVTEMTNGVEYACVVAAENSVGIGLASSVVVATPAASE